MYTISVEVAHTSAGHNAIMKVAILPHKRKRGLHMTIDGQYDADELLTALQQIESICRVRRTCRGCMFAASDNEILYCRFIDSPYTWDFTSCHYLGVEGGENND